MQNRHTQRVSYFKEQSDTTRKYVIPYIKRCTQLTKDSRVLEIGCGEGGNLVPFLEMGCDVVGVDISKSKIAKAQQFIEETSSDFECRLMVEDIYKVDIEEIGKFDVIFLRDVIEHIPNQALFMDHLKLFLKDTGKVFFGFPPWRMPFGGHQQICKSRLLSKLPYFHLFPKAIYKSILKIFGESEITIDELLEIKETGIGINRFEAIVKKNNYAFDLKTIFLINPNYEIKFGVKPRIQFSLIRHIPYLRDFLSTCYYCVIHEDKQVKI